MIWGYIYRYTPRRYAPGIGGHGHWPGVRYVVHWKINFVVVESFECFKDL